MLHRLLCLVIGLAVTSAAWAFEDWPQWRGPNRDAISIEKGLLDRWDQAPPLLWKAGGVGAGNAAVVVQGDIVCTTAERGGKLAIMAFSAKDGKELWRTEVDDQKHKYAGAAHSTPTMDGERIYAVSSHGLLACVKTATGELLWKRSYQQDFAGQIQDQGYSESPLIDGDKLVCTPTGPEAGIVALDKRTGKELWRSSGTGGQQLNAVSHSSMIISHGAGVKQYVQLMRTGLVGVDAETGKQLWRYERIVPGYWYSTPIARGDYVFSPCGGTLLKLAPTGDGGVKAQEIYRVKATTFWPRTGNAVLVGDYIYGRNANGMPQCIEFLTGKPMWEKDRGVHSGYGGAAVFYAEGNLYFRYENGVMTLVAATPEKYQVKGEFDSKLGPYAHAAISNGRLYLRGSGFIYCYDLKKK